VWEETGLEVRIVGLIGIYTDPRHVMAYPDGEVRQQCSVCFKAQLLGGKIRTSDETGEVKFVSRRDLDCLNIHPSMRLRIQHYLEGRTEPYIG
jgi:ADP-ribose pyrophosphatase YjhB (NUDIX family)